jgi:FHS family glucose/mannose:H+ symporter-like MFS transporter
MSAAARQLSGRSLLYAGFVLTGIVNTILGPVLPWLTARWSLSDASAGTLFTIQFAGGLTGGAVSGLIAARVGAAQTLAAGCVLMASGVLALALGDQALGSVGMCVAGLGLGFVIPTTNLMAARLAPHRSAAALGAVNLCWGLGAAIWPLTVGIFAQRGGVQSALLLGVALLAIMAACFAVADFPVHAVKPPGVPMGLSGGALTRLATFGACIALYSGIEAAFGGWITEYARRLTQDHATTRWEVAAAAFWGGLTGGRAVVAVWLAGRLENVALFGGTALVAAAIAFVLAVPFVEPVLAGAVLCGIGLAPVFPVTVAALAREFPTSFAGPMVALGSVGAGTLPLIVGAISNRTGSLGSGLATLVVCVFMLAALQWLRLRPAGPAREPMNLTS